MTRGVAQQRTEDGLDVEGVTAVEAHDHAEVRDAGGRGGRGGDAEVARGPVLDSLHQGAEAVLDHGALLDLVPVLVQEGALEAFCEVLALLSQPQAVLL